MELNLRRVAAYLLLGLGFSVVMGFMYMQYVYYDAMIETLGITNLQLGFLTTVLAVVGVVTALPLGAVVDRIDCRRALTGSLLVIIAGCGFFALVPTYESALASRVIGGVAMSSWYAAIYKTVRVMAPPDSIGKSFGLFGVGVALGGVLVNVAGLWLYDRVAAAYGLTAGLSAILWAFFTAGMIAAVAGHVLVMALEPAQPVKAESGTARGVRAVLKGFGRTVRDTGTWLYVLGDFCIYSFEVSISYFTPYFTAVLGATAVFSGVLAVFRQYGLRVLSAPFGGWLGDKLGSTARVIRGSLAVLAVIVVIVMMLPAGAPTATLIALTLALGLLGTMNISLQGSIAQDAMIPPENMALAVSMTSLFSADLFQASLFGFWLDTYGNGGYSFIWIYTLGIALLGVGVLTAMIRRRKRAEAGSLPAKTREAKSTDAKPAQAPNPA